MHDILKTFIEDEKKHIKKMKNMLIPIKVRGEIRENRKVPSEHTREMRQMENEM